MYELAQRVGSVFQNPKSQFFNLDTDSELAFGLENEAVRRKRSAAAWSRSRKRCISRTCGEKTSFLCPAGKNSFWPLAPSMPWAPKSMCWTSDGQSGSGGHCPPPRPARRFEAAGLHNRGGGAPPVLSHRSHSTGRFIFGAGCWSASSPGSSFAACQTRSGRPWGCVL